MPGTMNLLSAAKNNKLISITVFGVIAALLGATAEALYTPLGKFFVEDTEALMSLAFIFLGAGAGMLLVLLLGRKSIVIYDPKRRLQKKDIGKLIGIVLLTALANLLLLIGLQQESAATASILQNVTTITTVVFAALFLREKISKRLGVGVGLIILGSVALSVTNPAAFSFSTGSLIIIGGCISFGALYALMKLLSDRNPVTCSIIRGFGVGIIALTAAVCLGESLPSVPTAIGLMAAGFVGCGLSGMLLMYGQRHLGAAKAGAIFGIYPLLGAILAIPLLGEMPSASLLASLILFIPGMYFVTTKNGGKTAEQKPADAAVREDAEYLKSISEEKKSGMRNQLTSFGFLIVAMFFVMMVLSVLGSGTSDAIDIFSGDMLIPGLVLGIVLLITGTVLLLLGKRVLTAVTFLLMVPNILSFVLLGNNPVVSAISGIISLIFALILLTSKDPQKYAFAAVNALLGAAFISYLINDTACGIIVSVASVFLIWLSISSGTGKLQYSFAKHLAEDGNMTFSRCGAVIGFLLLAKITATELIFDYFTDTAFYEMDSVLTLGFIYTGLIVFVGVLLLFIGKRQATALFFFGAAVAFLLELWCDGVFSYLAVVFSLVFGILIVLRGRSLILPAILWIGEGFILLLYEQLEFFPEVLTAMLLMTLGCVVAEVYLSFAVFSEKPKLPVF